MSNKNGPLAHFFVMYFIFIIKKHWPFYFLGLLLLVSQVGFQGKIFTWHDQQRVLHLIFITVFSIGYLFSYRGCSYGVIDLLCFAFLGLGLVSVVFAGNVFWASVEWVLFAGYYFSVKFFVFFSEDDEGSRRLFVILCFAYSLLIVFKFLAAYFFSIILWDEFFISRHNAVDGFSNPRFATQVITIVSPIVLSLVFSKKTQRITSFIAYVLFVFLLALVILTDSRGAMVSLLLAFSCCLLFGLLGRKIFVYFVCAVLLAIVINFLLFFVFPFLFGREFYSLSIADMRTGLSGRGQLWSTAIAYTFENPWFGVGPMNFAVRSNAIGLHPHNIFLQISSEWGVPCLIIFCILTFHLISKKFFYYLKFSNPDINFGFFLFISMIATVLLSLVDGVGVMPMPLILSSVIFGLSFGRDGVDEKPLISYRMYYGITALMLAAFFIFLSFNLLIFLFDYDRFFFHPECLTANKPRFWSNGLCI